ncbi:MAG: phosphotransferase [Acidimicrobiia bacterium]|nr:phosphotransferase [Acidimicrobiia bacterium]
MTGFVSTDELRIGSGGGIRQFGIWRGQPVLARFGVEGTPGDPARHFEALQRLRLDEVPEGLESGEIDGVHWTIEAFHEGRSLDRLPPTDTGQVAAFLARLPPANAPIAVVDLATRELSAFSVEVGDLATSIRTGLEDLPAVVAHGDLWAGNLLFRDGLLVGVIDWDSWQERAIPGTDLLHMWAENTRRHRGLSYGDLVDEAFWSDGQLKGLVKAHLEQLGAPWNPQLQSLLGAAWWLAAVSGALRRTPALAQNPIWMNRNVHSPANTLTHLLT